MRLSLGRWEGLYSALGYFRKSRRQRRAAKANRKRLERLHRLDSLEPRLAMDAVGVNDHQVVNYGATVYISQATLTANDQGDPGQPLNITSWDATGTQGQVSFAGGVFTYQAPTNFSGLDAFSYTVSDGNGPADTATVTLTAAATEPLIEGTNATDFDRLGTSMSADGNWLAVGAMGATIPAEPVDLQSGKVQIYHLSNGTWSWHATINARYPEASASFGNAVSIDVFGAGADDVRVIIGAKNIDRPETISDDQYVNAGAAYIYQKSGATWTWKATLTQPGRNSGDAGDQFGAAVSIDGNYAVVGERFDGANAGKAYVFELSGGDWGLAAELSRPGGDGKEFAREVSVSGTTIVVSENSQDQGRPNNVYLYERNSVGWEYVAAAGDLIPTEDRTTGDSLGWAVSVRGDWAGIGARNDDSGAADAGSVYLLHRSGGTWSLAQKLTAPDPQAGAQFGHSVALDGIGGLVVGAVGVDGTNSDQGAAYAYTLQGGVWTLGKKVMHSATVGTQIGSNPDQLGYSVAMTGDWIIAGSEGHNVSGGAGGADGGGVLMTAWDRPAPNNAPTISAIANQTIDEDEATGELSFTIGDAETAAGELVVTATSSNEDLFPEGAIELGGSGASRWIKLTPAENANGTALVTVTVSDGDFESERTFTVNVGTTNDGPTISEIAPQTIWEDEWTGQINFTIGDMETDAEDLTVTAATSDGTLIPVSNIVLGGEGENRTVTITPTADLNGGPVTITLRVSDGTSYRESSFDVTVEAVNDAPRFIGAGNVGVPNDSEDYSAVWATGISAGPGETGELSWEWTVNSATPGLFAVEPSLDAEGNLSFRPADGMVGSASVTVRLVENASGSTLYSEPVTFTIGVEQPPIWAAAAGESRLEHDGEITFTVSLSWKPVGPVSVDWSLANGTANESDYGHTWQEAWTEYVPVPGYDVTVYETYTKYWNEAYQIGEEPNVTVFDAGSLPPSETGPDPAWLNGHYTTPEERVIVTFHHDGEVDSGWPTASSPGYLGAYGVTGYYACVERTEEIDHPAGWVPVHPLSGTLEFAAGETEKTVTVFVRNDTVEEANETFYLNLSNPQGVELPVPMPPGVGTILNDERYPPTISTFADQSMPEDGPKVIVFQAAGHDYLGEALVFTATSSNDGLFTTDGMVFGTQGSNRTLTLTPVANQSGTATITVTLTQQTPTGPYELVRTFAVEVLPDPILTVSEPAVNENGLQAEFTLTLSEPAIAGTSVAWRTVDRTARAGEDYVVASGVVTFAVGETTATVMIDLVNDGLDEFDEAFVLELYQAVHLNPADDVIYAAVEDDDAEPTLSIADAEAAEEAGLVEFVVTLSAASGKVVTVDWATNGGSPETDYEADSGTVVFAPGETTRRIVVRLVDHALDQGARQFGVEITGAVNASISGASAAQGAITDGDEPLVSVEATRVSEADGSVTVTVRLSNPSSETVTVDWAATDGTALASDYGHEWQAPWTEPVQIPGYDVMVHELYQVTIYWNAEYQVQTGEDSGYWVESRYDIDGVTVIYETFFSVGETTDSSWITYSAGTRPIYTTIGVGTQSSEDSPNPAWTNGYVSTTLDNRERITSDFHYDGTEPGLGWPMSSAPAWNGAFYYYYTWEYAERADVIEHPAEWVPSEPLAGELVFAPGETEKTITISLNDDGLSEPDQYFVVTLSGPEGAMLDPEGTSAEITILDDDEVRVELQDDTPLTPEPTATIAEDGGVLEFDFTLSGTPTGDVTFTAQVVDGTAPSTGSGQAMLGRDFVLVDNADHEIEGDSLEFTLNAAHLTQALRIKILDNGIWNPDRQFTIRLLEVTGANAPLDEATVTIENDDLLPPNVPDPTPPPPPPPGGPVPPSGTGGNDTLEHLPEAEQPEKEEEEEEPDAPRPENDPYPTWTKRSDTFVSAANGLLKNDKNVGYTDDRRVAWVKAETVDVIGKNSSNDDITVGTARLFADGSFNYTPIAQSGNSESLAYSGAATFKYSLVDADGEGIVENGALLKGLVTLNLDPAPFAITVSGAASVDEGAEYVVTVTRADGDDGLFGVSVVGQSGFLISQHWTADEAPTQKLTFRFAEGSGETRTMTFIPVDQFWFTGATEAALLPWENQYARTLPVTVNDVPFVFKEASLLNTDEHNALNHFGPGVTLRVVVEDPGEDFIEINWTLKRGGVEMAAGSGGSQIVWDGAPDDPPRAVVEVGIDFSSLPRPEVDGDGVDDEYTLEYTVVSDLTTHSGAPISFTIVNSKPRLGHPNSAGEIKFYDVEEDKLHYEFDWEVRDGADVIDSSTAPIVGYDVGTGLNGTVVGVPGGGAGLLYVWGFVEDEDGGRTNFDTRPGPVDPPAPLLGGATVKAEFLDSFRSRGDDPMLVRFYRDADETAPASRPDDVIEIEYHFEDQFGNESSSSTVELKYTPGEGDEGAEVLKNFNSDISGSYFDQKLTLVIESVSSQTDRYDHAAGTVTGNGYRFHEHDFDVVPGPGSLTSTSPEALAAVGEGDVGALVRSGDVALGFDPSGLAWAPTYVGTVDTHPIITVKVGFDESITELKAKLLLNDAPEEGETGSDEGSYVTFDHTPFRDHPDQDFLLNIPLVGKDFDQLPTGVYSVFVRFKFTDEHGSGERTTRVLFNWVNRIDEDSPEAAFGTGMGVAGVDRLVYSTGNDPVTVEQGLRGEEALMLVRGDGTSVRVGMEPIDWDHPVFVSDAFNNDAEPAGVWRASGLTPGGLYRITVGWVVGPNSPKDATYRLITGSVAGLSADRSDEFTVDMRRPGDRLLGLFQADEQGRIGFEFDAPEDPTTHSIRAFDFKTDLDEPLSNYGPRGFKISDEAAGTTHEYDLAGRLRRIMDHQGNAVEFGYETVTETVGGTDVERTRLKTITEQGGLVTTFNYSGNRLSSVVDATGRTATYATAGNKVTITGPETGSSSQRPVTELEFADGLLVKVTRKNKHFDGGSADRVTQIEYDAVAKRVSRIIEQPGTALERATWIRSIVVDGLVTEPGPTGTPGAALGQAQVRQTQTGHIGPRFEELTKEAEEEDEPAPVAEQQAVVKTADGGIWRYQTDRFGYLTALVKPEVMKFNEETGTEFTDEKLLEWAVWMWSRDQQGRLTGTWHFEMNAGDELVPAGIMGYSRADGHLTGVSYADNTYEVWTFELKDPEDPESDFDYFRVKTYTNRLGEVTTYQTDKLGNILETWHPNGLWEKAAYTAKPKTIDDLAGGLVDWAWDPIHGKTDYVYIDGLDDEGNTDEDEKPYIGLVEWIERDNGTVDDDKGNEADGDDFVEQSFTYDAHGNVDKSTNLYGVVTDYDFDALGNLVQVTHNVGAEGNAAVSAGHANLIETWVYDGVGQLLSEKQAADANSGRGTRAINHETRYMYDELGRAKDVFDVERAANVSYAYAYIDGGEKVTISTPTPGQASNVAQTSVQTVQYYDVRGQLTAVVQPAVRIDYFNDFNTTTGMLNFVFSGMQTTSNSPLTRYSYDELGRLREEWSTVVGRVAEDWEKTSYTYDVNDRIKQVIYSDPDGMGSTVNGSAAVNLARQTLSYEYFNAGNIIREYRGHTNAPFERVTSYERTEFGRSETVRDPTFHSSDTYYDAAGRVWVTLDKNGARTEYAYDRLDRITGVLDAEGHASSIAYFSAAEFRNVDGSTSGLVLDNRAVRLERVTDGRRNITWRQYDAYDRLVRIVNPDPDGHQQTTLAEISEVFQYNADGTLAAQWREVGGGAGQYARQEYRYDDAGRLVRVLDGLGDLDQYAYDRSDREIRHTQTDGTIQKTQYDALGRTVEQQLFDRNGTTPIAGLRATRIYYDHRGNVVGTIDGYGSEWYVHRDLLGRSVLEHGRTASYTDQITGGRQYSFTTYDQFGQVLKTRAKDGTTTSFTDYDNVGRVKTQAVEIASGFEWTYFRYDGNGNLTMLQDPANTMTEFVYDGMGRVRFERRGTTAAPPTAGAFEREFVYDANGNVIRSIDRNGVTTRYQYDAMNRRTGELSVGAPSYSAKFSYDLLGNLASVADNNAIYVYSGYDVRGRVGSVDQRYKFEGSGKLATTLTYDYLDAIISPDHTQARSGYFVTFSGAGVGDIAYEERLFDGAGRQVVVKRRTPDGGGTAVATDYLIEAGRINVQHREEIVAGSAGRGWVEFIESVTRFDTVLPGLVKSVRHENEKTGAALMLYSYEYDSKHLVTQSVSSTATRSYVYDAAGQITSVNGVARSYDAGGRQQSLHYEFGRVVDNKLPAGLGRLDYDYDQEGNRTSLQYFPETSIRTVDYDYDQRNRLVSVELWNKRADYVYDAFDRIIGIRRTSESGTKTELYVYGKGDAELARFDYVESPPSSGTNTPSLVALYLRDGEGNLLAVDDVAGQETYWALADRLQTVNYYVGVAYDAGQNTVTTTIRSQEFDTFGNVVDVSTGPILPAIYHGQTYDLDAALFRSEAGWYDPYIGENLRLNSAADSVGLRREANRATAESQRAAAGAQAASPADDSAGWRFAAGVAKSAVMWAAFAVAAIAAHTNPVTAAAFWSAVGMMAVTSTALNVSQRREAGQSVGASLLGAGLDTIGVGNIARAFDRDPGTWEKLYLSDGDRAEYAGAGVVDLFGVAGLAKAGLRGALNAYRASRSTSGNVVAGPGYNRKSFIKCFSKGTPISTEEGLKPIEVVTEADLVWAFDVVTGEWRLCRVLQTFHAENVGLMAAVSVAGETIDSSYHHPYWVLEGENLAERPTPEHVVDATVPGATVPGRWVDAGDLQVGDVLLLKPDRRAEVTAVEVREAVQTVYNFEVEDLHTYAVGQNAVLVHNNQRCLFDGIDDAVSRRMQAEELVENGGFQVRRIGGLERPALEAGTKVTIAAPYKTNAAGQVIDFKTGNVIERPQFGHMQGFENWRILKQAERLGLNQGQLDKFVNAHPHYFEIQAKKFNESHIGELLGPDPTADGRILKDMEKFFGL